MTVRNLGRAVPPPLVYLGFILAGWGLSQAVPDPGVGAGWEIRRYIAFVLIVGGLIIDAAAVAAFRRKGTPAEPWKDATALVTEGLYRWSRNPIYLGYAVAYIGLAVAMDSLIALALLIPCMVVVDRFVVLGEERDLSLKFGAAYDAYRSKVRRWL